MIQEIGLMIGAYILVRMFRFIIPPENVKENLFIKLISGIVILGTLFIMADLLLRGTQVYQDLLKALKITG
jgi:hypothetical protein